jgi:hypothetical protein
MAGVNLNLRRGWALDAVTAPSCCGRSGSEPTRTLAHLLSVLVPECRSDLSRAARQTGSDGHRRRPHGWASTPSPGLGLAIQLSRS